MSAEVKGSPECAAPHHSTGLVSMGRLFKLFWNSRSISGRDPESKHCTDLQVARSLSDHLSDVGALEVRLHEAYPLPILSDPLVIVVRGFGSCRYLVLIRKSAMCFQRHRGSRRTAPRTQTPREDID